MSSPRRELKPFGLRGRAGGRGRHPAAPQRLRLAPPARIGPPVAVPSLVGRPWHEREGERRPPHTRGTPDDLVRLPGPRVVQDPRVLLAHSRRPPLEGILGSGHLVTKRLVDRFGRLFNTGFELGTDLDRIAERPFDRDPLHPGERLRMLGHLLEAGKVRLLLLLVPEILIRS